MANSEQRMFNKVMVSAATAIVSERHPNDFQKLVSDPSRKQKMEEQAEKGVADIVKVISNVREKKMKSEAALSHLSEGRKQRFRQALDMKTFQMKITDAGVSVKRGQKMFRPTMKLSSSADIDAASVLQYASVIIEAVILVLEVVGVEIPDDEEEVQKAIKIVLDHLNKDKGLIKDVDAIKQANDRGDVTGMARAILGLVIDVFEDGLFWDITKTLLSDMPWYDWIITSAKIAAEIAALVATGGLAEIAELVATLANAAFFIEKLANLQTFKAMKNKM